MTLTPLQTNRLTWLGVTLAVLLLILFASSADAARPVRGAPTNTALPAISGTPQDGQTLTASTGTWKGSGMSFAYQWLRCDSAGACASLAGTTAQTYRAGSADVGATLRVRVTASNKYGSATVTSAQTAVVSEMAAPSLVSPPVISGTAQVGQTLTSSTASWSGTALSYSYQWYHCDSSGGSCSAGPTGQSYPIVSTDVGKTLRVTSTASNTGGSATGTSAATAVVAAATTSNVTSGPLTWAPPTLSNPITVQVANSGQACPGLPNQNLSQPWTCFLGAGQDYILKIDHRTAEASYPGDGLVVTGGNNVVIIGGQVTIPAPSSPSPERYNLVFHYQTGTVHVEGVLTDGWPNNCYIFDSAQATFQLENDRCTGINMYKENFSNPHSDIFRTWKSPPEIRIDRFTAEYDNTGLAFYGQQQSSGSWTYPGHVTLKHVNLRNTPASSTQCSNYTLPEGGPYLFSRRQTRIDIDQMYAETGWARASITVDCPAPGPYHYTLKNGLLTYNGETEYTASTVLTGDGTSPGSYMTFTNPSYDNIWGPNGANATVNYGIPSGGDYVLPGLAGTTYTSPGYTSG